MKQPASLALFAMALGTCAVPVPSFSVAGIVPDAHGVAAAQTAVASAQLAAAEAELRAATEALQEKKSQVAQGLAPATEMPPIEAQIARARAAVAATRTEVGLREREQQLSSRVAALQRPVDVEIRNADLGEAARIIARASGVSVNVDPRAHADQPVNVVARGVPLATVLDAIARQGHLLIAPAPNGVVLKPMPLMEVNGQRTIFGAPFGPWSSEWGTNPAAIPGFGNPLGGFGAVGGFGGGVFNGLAGASPFFAQALVAPPGPLPGPEAPIPGAGQPESVPLPPRPPGANPFRPFGIERGDGRSSDGMGLGLPGPPPISITPLGENTFVVAHPAPAPDGGPGVMLTVYRLDGMQQLRMVSSILHRLGPATGFPGSRRVPYLGSYGLRPGRPTAPTRPPADNAAPKKP
jgi:hypothetical protein